MFAGVTMRQENVLCFEYSLLGNVDRGCDFHRIIGSSTWRHEFHKYNDNQASTNNSKADIREPKFSPTEGCC